MNNLKTFILGLACFGAGAAAGYYYGQQKWKKYAEEDIADVKAFYEEKLHELTIPPDGTVFTSIDDSKFDKPKPNCNVNDIDDMTADDLMTFNGAIPNDPKNKSFGRSTLQNSLKHVQERGKPIVNYNNPPIEEVAKRVKEGQELDEDEIDILFDELDPVVQEAFIEAGVSPEEAIDLVHNKKIDVEFIKEKKYFLEDIWLRAEEAKENNQPYLIPEAEFNGGIPEDYDQVDLFYYKVDRTLCEEDDLEVDTEMMEEVVGFDFEELIDFYPVVYVRNDNLNIAYAIHRIDESYSKSVKGVIETPHERSKRLQDRRIKAGLEDN